jgi:hypothetical protein
MLAIGDGPCKARSSRTGSRSPARDLWRFLAGARAELGRLGRPDSIALPEYLRKVPSRRPRRRMTLSVVTLDEDVAATKLAATDGEQDRSARPGPTWWPDRAALAGFGGQPVAFECNLLGGDEQSRPGRREAA